MSTDPQYATDSTRPTETTEITARGGDDPWAATPADTAEGRIAPMAAPYTFDPTCTRRLRNCTDGENAAMPSTDE
jgi:hypothetical protein